MKNIIRFTILVLTLLSVKAQVNASRQLAPDCDTIITSTGETLLVSIEQHTDAFIQYRNCGASQDELIEQPISFVKEIRKAHESISVPEDAQKIDPLVEKNKLEMVTTLAVLSTLGVLTLTIVSIVTFSLVYLFGIPLLVLGGFFAARWVKRRTRSKPPYKHLKITSQISSIINMTTLIALLLVLFIIEPFSET